MNEYSKARGMHSIITPSERADPLLAKNRGRLITKLARLNHQKMLLERLNRVWIEQQQTTLSRLQRLNTQIEAIHAATGVSMPTGPVNPAPAGSPTRRT
ncbi:hypothetical protein [Algihabitans albus]|uniref:hypothetical protein n=1 Tax=Algihabitans albus TaxID=2164067 RepID=UPI000E5D8E3C|nr:hypothetical protein [Algihabitans albus]